MGNMSLLGLEVGLLSQNFMACYRISFELTKFYKPSNPIDFHMLVSV
jgi:hypothetical protein